MSQGSVYVWLNIVTPALNTVHRKELKVPTVPALFWFLHLNTYDKSHLIFTSQAGCQLTGTVYESSRAHSAREKAEFCPPGNMLLCVKSSSST